MLKNASSWSLLRGYNIEGEGGGGVVESGAKQIGNSSMGLNSRRLF